MKAGAVALVAVFLIGLIIGIQSGGEPEVEYRVLHDTETITKTETVEVPAPAPSECADLVKEAQRITKSAGRLDLATADMLDIMSRLRIIVATGDSNAANDLETELRKLNSRTIGATETMGEARPYFDKAAEACLEGTE